MAPPGGGAQHRTEMFCAAAECRRLLLQPATSGTPRSSMAPSPGLRRRNQAGQQSTSRAPHQRASGPSLEFGRRGCERPSQQRSHHSVLHALIVASLFRANNPSCVAVLACPSWRSAKTSPDGGRRSERRRPLNATPDLSRRHKGAPNVYPTRSVVALHSPRSRQREGCPELAPQRRIATTGHRHFSSGGGT